MRHSERESNVIKVQGRVGRAAFLAAGALVMSWAGAADAAPDPGPGASAGEANSVAPSPVLNGSDAAAPAASSAGSGAAAVASEPVLAASDGASAAVRADEQVEPTRLSIIVPALPDEPIAPEAGSRAQGVSGAATNAAPLELGGMALQAQTSGQRPGVDSVAGEGAGAHSPIDRGRHRIEGLVLMSAADGVGGGAQLRSGVFGVRGTASYHPLFLLVDENPTDKKFGAYHFSNSIQFNLDVLLVGAESDRGGSVGYRFNDVLGHGVTVAYQSAFEAWGQRFTLSFPVTYYPKATSRVRERLDIPSGDEINFPFGAGLQYGVGAAWVL